LRIHSLTRPLYSAIEMAMPQMVVSGHPEGISSPLRIGQMDDLSD
jgi:hypothetical protein